MTSNMWNPPPCPPSGSYGSGQAPPPPPPPPPYPWPPVPQAPPVSILGTLVKVGSLITVLMMCLGIGFYLGLVLAMAEGEPLVQATYHAGKGSDRIAIIPILGVITDQQVDYARQAVESILRDSRVKAVVLRVESPGGGATASDEILHEFLRLKDEGKLPVVASYGAYAASGGYYVSSFSDHIFAQPTTITGSIGVITQAFTMEELFTKKLGIQPEVLASTAAKDKDTGSMFRNWTEKDRAEIRRFLDAIQDQFVNVVADGRKKVMTREEVIEVATGRGLTAAEALESKLIDEVGYLDAALEKARQMGHTTDPTVVFYRPRPSLAEAMGLSVSGPVPSMGFHSLRRDETAIIRQWMSENSVPSVQFLFQP